MTFCTPFCLLPAGVYQRIAACEIWGYDFYGDERVVDSHIKNLRHKLDRDYIETVRGVGYRAAKETSVKASRPVYLLSHF